MTHAGTRRTTPRVDYREVAALAAHTPGTIETKAARVAAARGCTHEVARAQIYRARRHGYDIGAAKSTNLGRQDTFDRAETAAVAAATPGSLLAKGRALAAVAHISVDAAALRVAAARDEGWDIGEVPTGVDWTAVAQIAAQTPGLWKDKAAAIAEQTGVTLPCAEARLKALRRRGLYTGEPAPRPPKTTPQEVAAVAATVPGALREKASAVAETFQLSLGAATSRLAAARAAGCDIGVTRARIYRPTREQVETAAGIAVRTPGTLRAKAQEVADTTDVTPEQAMVQILAARREHLDIGETPSPAAEEAAAAARAVDGSVKEKAAHVAAVLDIDPAVAYSRVRYAHRAGLDVGTLEDNHVDLAEAARIAAATDGSRAAKIRAVATELGCSRGAAAYRVEAAAAAGHDLGEHTGERRSAGDPHTRSAVAAVAAATPGRMADKARAVAAAFGCSQKSAVTQVWRARDHGLDIGELVTRTVDYDRVAQVCRSAGPTTAQKTSAIAEAMGCSPAAAGSRLRTARARGFDVGEITDPQVDYVRVAEVARTVPGARAAKDAAVAEAFDISAQQAASWVSTARNRGLDIGPGREPVDRERVADVARAVPGRLSAKSRAVAHEFGISESVARHRLLSARRAGFDIGVAPAPRR